ncbi:catalase family peroxidase [Solirubrobacter soli]|uniref:catalase family peroxidase n=1 Tax=Solirubrobacter soli TaxID=363832 RepID=UPI000425E997|nr:catalase family peroxidase [Solirubrobacter soli]
MTDVNDVLDAMEDRGRGVPGFRRAHARGLGFRGRFVATPEAARLTTAEHLQGGPIETVVRFSNGAVSPYTPDRKSAKVGNALGMAVRFALPSGGVTTSAALSLKVFAAGTPEGFHDLIVANAPALPGGLPNPLRVAAFVARHPDGFKGVVDAATLKPTLSFATTRFNGMHAFYAVDAGGARRAFRFRWLPVAGVAAMARENDAMIPPQYLMSELRLRVERGPVEWDLVFQLAEPGDPTDDVTKLWPEERTLVTVGRLTVDGVHADQDLVDGYVFDPLNLPPGIEPSADPLLHFRSSAYSESHRRRTSERRPRITPG